MNHGEIFKKIKKSLIGKCVQFFGYYFVIVKSTAPMKINTAKHCKCLRIKLFISIDFATFYTFVYDLSNAVKNNCTAKLPLHLNWTPREHWKSFVMQLDWWRLSRR